MFDIAINAGRVIDTENRVSHAVHVGILNGKVAALSDKPLQGHREIHAAGLIVSPGFIDVHGHVDGDDYTGELSAFQGVTTTVGGNCGLSPLALPDFFTRQKERGFIIHQAELVGHSFSLRKAVGICDPYERASEEQTMNMCALAEAALQGDAYGVSFGLDYSPGAGLKEIYALAQVCARYKRVMAVHTRLFTLYDLISLYEIICVAKQTGVRLLFSHFVYQYGVGIMTEALDIIDRARASGLDIWIDTGMYTDWAAYIGTASFDERSLGDNEMMLSDILVATGSHMGERLDEELYAFLRKHEPDASVIYFTGEESEIYEAAGCAYAMPSSDTGAYAKGEGHPQIAGTFPRYFRRMVREQKLLSWEEAIYRASLLPAQTFGLHEKGVLKPGMDADVVLFNPDILCDTADYPDRGKPDAHPQGVAMVLVDGIPVVENGILTGARPGKILRS